MSMSNKYDIIFLGAGPGGYIAALKAAQMGASVAIEQVSAERLMAEQHQSRNASVARLVFADGSLSAS